MVLRRLEGEITQKEWIFVAGFVHEYRERERAQSIKGFSTGHINHNLSITLRDGL